MLPLDLQYRKRVDIQAWILGSSPRMTNAEAFPPITCVGDLPESHHLVILGLDPRIHA
jgi:hypothetical protein